MSTFIRLSQTSFLSLKGLDLELELSPWTAVSVLIFLQRASKVGIGV